MIEKSPTEGDAHRVELNLRDINHLFNTIDPSPFHEKDVDHDAEEFNVSWTRELPLREPLVLVIYLSELPAGKDLQPLIESRARVLPRWRPVHQDRALRPSRWFRRSQALERRIS